MSGRLARGQISEWATHVKQRVLESVCCFHSVKVWLITIFLALAVGFREHSLGWAANGRLVGITLFYKVVPWPPTFVWKSSALTLCGPMPFFCKFPGPPRHKLSGASGNAALQGPGGWVEVFAKLFSSRSLFPRELPNAETQPEGMPRTRANLQVSFVVALTPEWVRIGVSTGRFAKRTVSPPLGSSWTLRCWTKIKEILASLCQFSADYVRMLFLITNATQKPKTQYLGVSASNPNKSARTSGTPSLEEASVFDRPTGMMWFDLPSICRWAEQAEVHSDRSRSTNLRISAFGLGLPAKVCRLKRALNFRRRPDIQLHARQLHNRNCWGVNCVIVLFSEWDLSQPYQEVAGLVHGEGTFPLKGKVPLIHVQEEKGGF